VVPRAEALVAPFLCTRRSLDCPPSTLCLSTFAMLWQRRNDVHVHGFGVLLETPLLNASRIRGR